MTTARLLTASLGILGIAQAAYAAEPVVPPDVMRLAAAEGKIQATIGADTVAQPVFVDLFAGMLVETATVIAREQGLVERLDVGSSGFRALAERNVTGPIDSALARGGTSRRDALYDVMMTYSTRDAAHALLAEWLTAPAIGNLAVKAVDAASKKEEEAFLAARKAADAERGDRPLTDKERTARMLEDAVRDARRDKELLAARNQERFRRQVVPESGNGAFRVPGDAAELVYDYGNGGDANGVIDAGEWIAFTLPLENATREHWFSSSAWVRASSACVWTPASREIELPELAPGAKGAVTIRAFVSESCADQSRARFTVTIRDTHRNTEQAPTEVGVGLVVTNVGAPTLRRYTMDVDHPGSSRAGTVGRLDPDTHAELSAGVNLGRGGAERALQAWGFSWPVDSIVVDHSFSLGEPMVPASGAGGSAFAPNDDLDLSIGGQLARGLPVGRGPVGGGVVALETRVEYPGAEGAWAPPRSIAVPKSTPVVPTPVAPSADEALAIFRKHLTIEARETDPARGALVAVSTEAYDATVDKDAFKLDWCRATLSVKPGEPDPCDPKATREPAKGAGQMKMPSLASQAAETPAQKAPQAPWVPPASTWTLGLNQGTVFLDAGDLDTGDLYETSYAESQYTIGYARGVRNRLRIGAAFGDGVYTISGGLGRGVAAPRLGRLELAPYLDAGVSVFSGSLGISGADLYGSSGGETTAFADLGTDLRLHLSRGLSVSSGIAWRQQLATVSGPVLDGMVYTGSEELRDATGLRFQVGLGLAFSGGRVGTPRAMAARGTDEAAPLAVAVPAGSSTGCGGAPCADGAADKDASVTKVPLPAFEIPAAYTFRHYTWTEFNTWASGARNTVLLSLDLGARSMLRVDQWDGQAAPSGLGTFDGRETLVGLGYSRGLQNRLRTRLFYGSSDTPYESSVLTLAAGYGRAIPFARSVFEVEPHADAGVALFSLNNGGETTGFLDVGADARWFLLREVSLYAGAAWRQQLVTLSGPVVNGLAFPADPVRDATGLRFQLGVGYHF